MIEESFRPARTPNVLGLLGAAAILGYGVISIVAQQQWGFGLLGIIAGTIFAVLPFQYLRWRQPTLTLNRVGFTVTLPSLSREPYTSGPVPWHAVLGVSIIGGGRYTPMRTIVFEQFWKVDFAATIPCGACRPRTTVPVHNIRAERKETQNSGWKRLFQNLFHANEGVILSK
jgi:hypothetical protein